MDLIQKVKKTIQDYHLVPKGGTLVLGVSGGPDSVSLVFVLNALKYDLGIQLHLAHLNHQLRPSANTDEKFVKNLAQRLNIPCTIKSVGIKKGAKGSLEENARIRRFDFLIDVAKKQKASCIALGHTQDDLAETVLMRILRGTGLDGLRAILPKRTIMNTIFIRPLIDVSRWEIMEFLNHGRLSYRNDPTNKNLKFFRNKLRHKLLPLLGKEYNPNIKNVLANLAQTVGEDYAFLDLTAQALLQKHSRQSKNRSAILFPLNKFHQFPLALQRMCIRLAIEKLKGDTNRLGLIHFKELEDLLKNRRSGSVVDLPYPISVIKSKKFLEIKKVAL